MNRRTTQTSCSLEHIDLATSAPLLSTFEREIYSDHSRLPIADYSKTLRHLRKAAQSIITQHDEIAFARSFRLHLLELTARHNISSDHFSIDVSGDPLLVKEQGGEHLISPTHFENGAYFSHPHADHQMDLPAEKLPRLKIGKYVRFGRNASVNAGGDVIIGNGAWLSPGSQLLRQDHDPYGRPSVGSRTVSMTKLPPITLGDYAWVGREAMVGWGADYLGKCSIVATRSFCNTWVGDYSVVGDHGKTLQYMPFKAYLIEQSGVGFEDILRIQDWSAVNSQWLEVYRNNDDQRTPFEVDDGRTFSEAGNVLVIEAAGPSAVASFDKHKVDVICSGQQACASILQWCIDNRRYNLRFRGDLDRKKLPFATAGYFHYRRKYGYDAIVCHTSNENMSCELLAEISRVALPNAQIAVKSSALHTLDQGALKSLPCGKLIEKAEIRMEGTIYTVLEKEA